MKVLELKNILREEGQIFYLSKYACDAVLEFPTSVVETKIMFTIESTPLGQKNIELSILKDLSYPLVPLTKALKEFILKEDFEGRLPC